MRIKWTQGLNSLVGITVPGSWCNDWRTRERGAATDRWVAVKALAGTLTGSLRVQPKKSL